MSVSEDEWLSGEDLEDADNLFVCRHHILFFTGFAQSQELVHWRMACETFVNKTV